MNFIVRSAKMSDVDQIYELSLQFTLLNLPPDKKKIRQKIETSMASFAGKLPVEKSNFMFVCEDLESGEIAGCSQLVGQKGTPTSPNYSFKIYQEEKFSPDLSVGFIHKILKLRLNTQGPSEVGGLVVDRSYRKRPEKVGKLTSLSRFVYVALNPERFRDELLTEMAPPLTDEGRSEFWEALGRRFTGMPYKEADELSQQNKDFIKSLFPDEPIYLCLLDAKARLVIGRVGTETQPALHMLENLGFKYAEEIDPFDGGPHLMVPTKDVTIIKNGSFAQIELDSVAKYSSRGFIGYERNNEFYCGMSAIKEKDGKVFVPEQTISRLNLEPGQKVFYYLSESEG
ncbi:MAG: arginine N-succinyltransferase [Bdellovibrionales bacterium]|nr:arginine N-succinyltransferase [Bdellovibrionales bacterium]